MKFPASLQEKFDVIDHMPGGKILQCFRVKDKSRGAKECMVRLLPDPFCQDQSVVERLHNFFSRFSQIPNRTHLPSVYSVSGLAGGVVYILEELVPGIGLPAFAEKRGHLSGFLQDAMDVVGKACEALHHAHQKDVLHLCITPEDLLVDESTGKVKLVGFGAQVFVQTGLLNSLSEKCKKHAAPEVLNGQECRPCSDVYSLALAISDAVPQLLEGGDIIQKALSQNPGERYQRAREFEEKLNEVSRSIPNKPDRKRSRPDKKTWGGLQPVLKIMTEPAAATVRVNGTSVGTTTSSGLAVPWKPGMVIVIEKAGYESQTLKFPSLPDGTDLNIKLIPVLNLVTNPWGASVKVNGQVIGVTPREGLRVAWDQGEIVVEKDGFKTETLTFETPPSQAEITLGLTPYPAHFNKLQWAAMAGAAAISLFIGILAAPLFTGWKENSGTTLLNAKDTEIGQLRNELKVLAAQKGGEISTLKQTIDKKELLIDQLKGTEQEKQRLEAEIANLRKGAPQMAREISILQESLRQKELIINRLTGIEQEKQKLEAEIAREKQDRQKDIEVLKDRQKDIDRLKAILAQTETDRDALKRNIADRQKIADEWSTIAGQRQQEIQRLEREKHQLEQRITQLEAQPSTILPSGPWESGPKSSDRQIKIINVKIPSAVQSGRTFSVTVEAENSGEDSEYGGITISLPDPSGLRLISADPGRMYAPGSVVMSATRDKIRTIVPMAERWIDGWGEKERHHLNVEIQAGRPGTYPVYVRCALKRMNVGNRSMLLEPDTSNVADQQGFPVRVYNVTVR